MHMSPRGVFCVKLTWERKPTKNRRIIMIRKHFTWLRRISEPRFNASSKAISTVLCHLSLNCKPRKKRKFKAFRIFETHAQNPLASASWQAMIKCTNIRNTSIWRKKNQKFEIAPFQTLAVAHLRDTLYWSNVWLQRLPSISYHGICRSMFGIEVVDLNFSGQNFE